MELTPQEVLALVRIASLMPEHVMVAGENDELVLFETTPGYTGLIEKIQQEVQRDDVKPLFYEGA